MDIIEFAEKQGYALYPVQKVILKLIYGLELDDTEKFDVKLHWQWTEGMPFTEKDYVDYLTQKDRLRGWEPGEEAKIVAASMGRRSGKSTLQVLIALFEVYRKMQTCSTEKGDRDSRHLMMIGPTLQMSKSLFHAFQAEAESSVLRELISRRTGEKYSFGEGGYPVEVLVRSGLAKALRGISNKVTFVEEFAHFPLGSSEETWLCISPQADIGNKLMLFSSPGRDATTFRKVWKEKRRCRNHLSFRIPTWEIVPSLDRDQLARLQKNGHASFDTEWGAEFLTRVEVPIRETLLEQIKEQAAERGLTVEDLLYEKLHQ